MDQGIDVTDEELMTYISESSTMSKSLEEYEGKPASVTLPRWHVDKFWGTQEGSSTLFIAIIKG